MQNASKFLFFLISLSLVSAFAFAAHDTAITIDPNITLCGVDSVDYTVTVENLAGSTDKIREVRIYDDLDNDGQRDAGITDFNCFTDVSPPTGWTVHDELAINNYCRYTTSSSSGNVNKISPGNSKEFTFKATLDNSSLSACGNTFKVETIDDKIPSGEVQFKFPQIHVDCSPPIIQKMVDKPKIPMSALCNEDALVQGGENEACNYWITQNTTISFSAQDNNTLVDNGEIVEAPENLSCDAGLDYCQWKYSLDGDETPENFESQCEESGGEIEGDWCVLSDGNILEFEFDFDEDSEHTLIVECYDLAGNKTSLTETDKVDGTDPETTKELVGAQKIENGIEWIDTNSSVVITAADPDPTGFSCNIGVEATFYKLSLEDGDSACENQEEACFPMELPEEFAQCYWSVKDACVNSWEENYDSYQDCVIDQALNQCGLSEAGWQLYEGPIENIEESCHNLTFFSVDELGNVEEPNVNCFFVDKTPPIIEKEVGDPKVECEEEGCDWFIGKNTPITLSCNDPEPHPSGDVTIHYRYRVDEGNGFGSWTDINSTQAEEIVFTFQENSMHELEYWCTDAVDKESQHYFEIDKVDSEPPIITKEMIGTQHLGYRDGVLNEEACPPNPNENDVCYVADNGENGVSILAADVNSIHAVHGVSCTYEVWWHTDSENCESQYDVGTNRCLVDSDEFSDHAEVIFTEDSTHDLEIVCQDALGNSVEDIEQFLVDSNPPETTKMYGEPFFACSDWCELECEYEGDGDCVSSCEQNFCGGFDAQGGEPYPHWITSDTNVSLWSEDAKVGVDKIYWRNMVITDPQGWGACNYAQPYDHGDIVENGPQPIFCNPELYSQFIPGYNEIPFTPVDGNHAVFNKEEESCHVIEYYSVDLLGNEEPLNWQCVFVDNSPPVGNKDIGKPHVIKTDGQVCEDNGEDVEESSFEVGDLVHQLSADELPVDSAGNHCAIGVAFDGENLYYNRCSDDNIYKINPVTGELLDTFDTGISLNPNAMAYDATRNGIWFGTQSCDGTGMPIYFWDLSDDSVTLEFHVTSATINPATGDDFLGFCFLDGLAFNANGSGDADDELWFSDDVNPNLGVFRPDGSFVTGYDSTDTDPDLALLSGLAIGGSNLYMGNNGGGDVFRANSTTLAFVDQFASEDERLEDMECDPNTFAPTEVMWVRHTPQGNPADDLISAFAIESGTCGVGGEEPPVCQGEEWVTTETIFTLSCDDPEPHPVDHSIVHWRFSFHPNGDINGLVEYSEWNWDEGPVQVSFEQESLHNLEYYCEDALGNQNEVDIEYFFVEDTPPIITKTIEGPSFAPEGSSCDQEATKNSENKCYVDTATRILVEAVDPE
ncbi:MAG TPA: hypothetical protein VFF13_05535, partial [archaeon]|nr:hypothetical protein [archaeon]